jgi:hypothetical protein
VAGTRQRLCPRRELVGELERIAFINAGGDPTSSDWTDRLETTKGKKRKLRYHKAA